MSRERLILAVDQGTTNTKVLLMDRAGAVRARASRPLGIAFPEPGWVEQDARELWASVVAAMDDCLEQVQGTEVAAVGVTNQRESVIVWDRRSGEPAGPCITWQCRRTAAFCAELHERGLDRLIRERSGQPIDPLFSASKAAWLLAHIPDGHSRAAAGELCMGTVDSWLLWRLSGGARHATDPSNASRTQLLNLRSVGWDAELAKVFGIPAACLPTLHASSSVFGETTGCGRMPAGVPVASLIGDSHAALFGHAAFVPGSVKATYGTGSSLMTLTSAPVASIHGLSTTIAWARPDGVSYALEGNITNTGGTMQWLAQVLRLPGGAEEIAGLAGSVPDSAGAYLVPAFAGLGAPHWDSGARGVLCGLTRGTTAAHLARAALESIAFQVHDVFEALGRDAGIALPALLADGGASRSDALMQFQADILERPVIRSSSPDLSAIGAAWLAGLAVGYWGSLEELAAMPRPTDRFEPCMAPARRRELIDGWQDALARTKSSAGAHEAVG
ncbi:MAG: glycerol kinase GlpK [Bryobacterales bacterium]|nr:glycerol kinase GlpK [Bryobacterales bacterium]